MPLRQTAIWRIRWWRQTWLMWRNFVDICVEKICITQLRGSAKGWKKIVTQKQIIKVCQGTAQQVGMGVVQVTVDKIMIMERLRVPVRKHGNLPRPLLVQFNELERKGKIMKKIFRLGEEEVPDDFADISVKHDLTPSERETEKALPPPPWERVIVKMIVHGKRLVPADEPERRCQAMCKKR